KLSALTGGLSIMTTATPFSFATLTELDKRNLPRPAAITTGLLGRAANGNLMVSLAQCLSGQAATAR
ncbi:hypothetical protein, partial [Mesorhizobium sp.]|uniref:hypothetical protein n=1 Tax=Mesorhizobium sp. TaxID=1871066 RepID=UPI0025DB6D1A